MNYRSFDEVLRTWIAMRQERFRKSKDPDWWWASGLGMCLRKHYLRRMGLTPTEKKEFRIMFLGQDGTAAHEWREAAARDMEVLVEAEGRLVDRKLKYKGRFDLIVKLNHKKLVLIDIKTQRPEAFFRRSRRPDSQKVSDFQKMQLASYVYFARKKYPQLKEARLYFVDRGGGLREEFIFNFGKLWFGKVLAELKLLNKHWSSKTFPKKTTKKWECRFCDHKTICKAVDKKKLTFKQVKKQYA